MYKNIGSKIKKLAKFICWLCIITGVIAAAVIGVQMAQANNVVIGVVTFVVVAALYFLIGWVASLTTYGIGQIAEDVDEIKGTIEKPEEEKTE